MKQDAKTKNSNITLKHIPTLSLNLVESYMFHFLHKKTDNRDLAHYLARHAVVHTGLRAANINQVGLLRYIRILTLTTAKVGINSIIGLVAQALTIALIVATVVPYKIISSLRAFMTHSQNVKSDDALRKIEKGEFNKWVTKQDSIPQQSSKERFFAGILPIALGNIVNDYAEKANDYIEGLREIGKNKTQDSYFTSAVEKSVLGALLNRTHMYSLLSLVYDGGGILSLTLKVGLAVLNLAVQCLMVLTVPVVFVVHGVLQTLYNLTLKLRRSQDIFEVSDFDEFTPFLSESLKCKGTSLDGHKQTVHEVLDEYLSLLSDKEILDAKNAEIIKQKACAVDDNMSVEDKMLDAEEKWNRILIQLSDEDRETALLLKLVLHADHQYMDKKDSRGLKDLSEDSSLLSITDGQKGLEVVKYAGTITPGYNAKSGEMTTENVLDLFKYGGIDAVREFLAVIRDNKKINAKKQLLDKEFENVCKLNGLGDAEAIKHFMMHHMYLYPAVGNNLGEFVKREEQLVAASGRCSRGLDTKEPKLQDFIEFSNIQDEEVQRNVNFCLANGLISESEMLHVFINKGNDGLKEFFQEKKIAELCEHMNQQEGQVSLLSSDVCALKRAVYLLNTSGAIGEKVRNSNSFSAQNVIQRFTQDGGFDDAFKIDTLKLEFLALLDSSTDYYEREFCRFLLKKGVIDDSIFSVYYAVNPNITASMIMRDLHLQFASESALTDSFIMHSALKVLTKSRASTSRDKTAGNEAEDLQTDSEQLALDYSKAELLLHYFMRHARNKGIELREYILNSSDAANDESVNGMEEEQLDALKRQITEQALFLNGIKNVDDILFFLFLIDESSVSADDGKLFGEVLSVKDEQSLKALEDKAYKQLDKGWFKILKESLGGSQSSPEFEGWLKSTFDKMKKTREFDSLTGFTDSDKVKEAYKDILMQKIKDPFSFESRRYLFRLLIAAELYDRYHPDIEIIALRRIADEESGINGGVISEALDDYCHSLGIGPSQNLTVGKATGETISAFREIYGSVSRYIGSNIANIKELIKGEITVERIRQTAPMLLTLISAKDPKNRMTIAPILLEILNSEMLKSEIAELGLEDDSTASRERFSTSLAKTIALIATIFTTASSARVPFGGLISKLVLLASIKSNFVRGLGSNIVGMIQGDAIDEEEEIYADVTEIGGVCMVVSTGRRRSSTDTEKEAANVYGTRSMSYEVDRSPQSLPAIEAAVSSNEDIKEKSNGADEAQPRASLFGAFAQTVGQTILNFCVDSADGRDSDTEDEDRVFELNMGC